MNNENYILKWFNGEITNEELAQLKKSEAFKNIEKITHYSSHIDLPKINIDEAHAHFISKRNANKKIIKTVPLYARNVFKYAASIIVLLITSYFLFFNINTTYTTSYAENQVFSLPDNSEVILNSNSKISFSKKEWATKRNLNLNGEAYFKVEKGEKFNVKTDKGIITVLGTQFNVKERKNFFEVKCFEGTVQVSYKNTVLKLIKGQQFKVLNGNIDSINVFNTTNKNWLQKESNFISTPLMFVFDELQNQYGYKIQLNNIDTTKLYTGGFTHSNIKEALQTITIPLQLKYTLKEKKIIISKND